MRRSLWRFFPLAVVAGIAFVVLVNVGLVYAALCLLILHLLDGPRANIYFAF